MDDNTRWQMPQREGEEGGKFEGAPLGECHRIWALTLSAAFVSKIHMKTE